MRNRLEAVNNAKTEPIAIVGRLVGFLVELAIHLNIGAYCMME
ncbi:MULTISPECIES: hypothetical protein [unclassified Okeania]|nr:MULTISPECIES: hypothetical protein [unclassified Okeania]